MISAVNGNEPLRSLRRFKEFPSQRVRNGAIRISVALKQRPLVSSHLGYAIEFIGRNEPGEFRVVVGCHVVERRKGALKDEAARLCFRRELHGHGTAERATHQDDLAFLDIAAARGEYVRRGRP